MQIGLALWSGQLGGAERFTADLAHAMRARGVEATVLFVTGAASIGTKLRASDVPYRELGLERGAHVVRYPRRLARLAREVAPDGLVTPSAGYLVLALRVGGYSARVLAVEHGRALQPRNGLAGLRGVLGHAAERVGSRSVYAHLGVSEATTRHVRRYSAAQVVTTIHNGVDIGTFCLRGHESDTEGLVVGCAARLIPGKGIEQLIDAVDEVKHIHGLSLRIAGDGPLRAELESIVHRKGLGEIVKFEGWHEDMARFWRMCDVAVVPSSTWIESFGVVGVEAMASGLPVIATTVGGLGEVVADGETGILVQPGAPAAIAAALTTYADNPALRREHGRAGRLRAERQFDVDHSAQGYLELLRA